ncbi:unnamed protein product [Didymodactylos carnosus]|uniref:FACT complex subunit n=1 Tax=Didymodactylos carnosus TaxID=1234261 RepID=A0A815LTR4_9BILA|nr:unnamed protein product [Didymodactylos carnosus]CAF4301473.1 unnamed protein product [Didymodactylos carnosus]
MPDVVIDAAKCLERIRKLYASWRSDDEQSSLDNNPLTTVDAVVITTGQNEDFTYSKSAAIQTWLFGYEMHDVLLVFCEEVIIFLTGAKKINYLKQIENGHNKNGDKENAPGNFKFLVRKDNDQKHFDDIIELIKSSRNGKTIGVFSKDKMEGPFCEQWQTQLNEQDFTSVDISTSVGYLLAVKDDSELTLVKKACEITGKLYSKYLKDQIINIVDTEKKVKHSKLSDNLETILGDEKYVTKADIPFVEMCYPAIIQSGGSYNLKFSATNDKSYLHYGAILCAFGIRYKSYCSNLVRTLIVNPTDEMQNAYKFLLDCEELLIKELTHNARLCDVYKTIREKVENERPEYAQRMTSNLGTVIGVEFRESSLAITTKCTARAKKGMTFQISIGFSELENSDGKDDQSKIYALFIGDTVVVNEDNPCTIYTSSKKDISHIAIILKDEADTQDDDADAPIVDKAAIGPRRTAVLENKTRNETVPEETRRVNQKQLLKRLNENAKIRLTSQGGKVSAEKTRKINNSYKSENQLPQDPDIQDLKLFVDKRYETIILPINGTAAAFHISTIKNASLAVEGEYIYLRINFFNPGGLGKQNDNFDKEHVYIKELTYRASNEKKNDDITAPANNLNHVYKLILDVQKKFKDEESERKQMEGVVKQDALTLNSSKTNPKLKDLYIRPSLANKKINGTLEAHTNGFRYTSVRGDKIDILYSNVKHAFYQPCDNEMIILIHFHLKHAIVFGRKKQIDVQFYTEVGEITTDLGKHRNMHDKDDMLAEQAERDLRNRLKSAFQGFIEKVVQQKNFQIEFEKPIRALGFHGTPHRSMVLLLPTTSCLVHLTEWPPFVVVLEEVELVHFERVHFQLKNFDMVFVLKDYQKKVQTIQAIPMNELDHIKDWLNSCELCYTEGPQALNWAKIMKTITDDLTGFFQQGGWSFLEADTDNEGEGGDGEDDSDAEEDDYEPSGDDSGEASESEYSGEEEDVKASDESEEESDVSEDALGSDEESGKSWSELEEEARKADAEKVEYESDHGDRKKKSSSSKPTNNKRKANSPPPTNNKKKK